MRAALASVGGGIVAVGSKELRGRMRGPRAFIALTLYLALLAGFTVMVYLIQRQLASSQASFGGSNPYLSAQVGQMIFATMLLLQTLLVLFLAPAALDRAHHDALLTRVVLVDGEARVPLLHRDAQASLVALDAPVAG